MATYYSLCGSPISMVRKAIVRHKTGHGTHSPLNWEQNKSKSQSLLNVASLSHCLTTQTISLAGSTTDSEAGDLRTMTDLKLQRSSEAARQA